MRTKFPKAKRPKLIRIDVVYVHRAGRWHVNSLGVTQDTEATQAAAIHAAVTYADGLIPGAAAGVTVRIHRKDGRIREERTYPRRADPKRSRG